MIAPRHLSSLCAASLLILAAGGLGGCGKSGDSSSPDTKPGGGSGGPKKLSIACIPKATTHSYWKAAEAGARRAGTEFNVDIQWQGPLDDSKVADQITIFDNLAASGVDGILLAPCDDKALAPHVRTADKRGTPIAIFDSPLEGTAGTDFITFVATDNKKAGELAAQTLTKEIGDTPAYGSKVLMIRFTEGSASTRLREEGFDGVLKAGGKLQIAAEQFTDGSMAGAQRVAETLLGNYVQDNKLQLDGIFASNQPTAEGTYNAVRALKSRGVEVKTHFVGFDDSELLRQGLADGVIEALVVQDPEKMGYLGVQVPGGLPQQEAPRAVRRYGRHRADQGGHEVAVCGAAPFLRRWISLPSGRHC